MQGATIRISKKTPNVPKKLAASPGVSMQMILERTIENYRRQPFLEQVNERYTKLKQNPADWQAFTADVLDSQTIAHGLPEGENWDEAGEVQSRQNQVRPCTTPAGGKIGLADFPPTRGCEHKGKRPVLIISDDIFSQGPAELVIVLPITSKKKSIPSHFPIPPPEGGLKIPGYVTCEAIRSISKDRLPNRFGNVSQQSLAEIENRIRILLGL